MARTRPDWVVRESVLRDRLGVHLRGRARSTRGSNDRRRPSQEPRNLTETADQHSVLLTLFCAKDVDGLRIAIPTHVGDLWRRIKTAESSDELQNGN